MEGAGQPAGLVLTFDAEKHEYRLHDAQTPAAWGRLLPSVTQILHAVGLIDDQWYMEEHRTRGRYVHQMIAFEEREGLDESTVDQRLAGHLAAYRRFIAEAHPGPCRLLERPLADAALGYAGTPDQVRELHGRLALIDHKSGTPLPWHPLQTGAYESLVRLSDLQTGPLDRYALYLHRNGTYRLERHADRRDFKVFQACVAVTHFKGAGRHHDADTR